MNVVKLKDVVGFATHNGQNVRDNDTLLRKLNYCIFETEKSQQDDPRVPLTSLVFSENPEDQKRFVEIVKANDEKLWGLAQSILLHGLENKIKIKISPEGKRLGDGARRYLAYCVLYCLDPVAHASIPCELTEKDGAELDEVGIVVNLHRQEVSKSSLAKQMFAMKRAGLSNNVIAEKLSLVGDGDKTSGGYQKVYRYLKIVSKATPEELSGWDDGTVVEQKLIEKYYPPKPRKNGDVLAEDSEQEQEAEEPITVQKSGTRVHVMKLSEVRELLDNRKTLEKLVEKVADMSEIEKVRYILTKMVVGLRYKALKAEPVEA